MTRTGIVAVSLSIACLLIAGTVSEAARNPTKPEKHNIKRLLDRQGLECTDVPGSCHRKIKVSTKLETWAAVYIRGSQVQGVVASLHRKNHKWRVHQVGNGGGCGVPRKVRKDLKLACY